MSKSIYILMLLLLGACSHVVLKPPADYTPEQFWKAQEARARIEKSYLGKMNLGLTDEKGSARGLGQILSKEENKTRIELRDAIGRMQFLIVLSGMDFVAYYPERKRAYSDKVSGKAYLAQVLGIPLQFHQLASIFLGHIEPLLRERFHEWKWDSEKGVYVAKAQSDLGPLTIRIDPKHNLPVSLISDHSDIEVVYSGHKICCGQWVHGDFRLSHELEVRNHRNNTSIGVNWRSIESAPASIPAKAFQTTLPTGTLSVPLKEK